MFNTAYDDFVLGKDRQHGPLPLLLLLLTIVTGMVDAVSYLSLSHVFVANMTGNVVFLGFAVGGARDFSIPSSLAAIAAFLGGALLGGRLGSALGHHRGRLLAIAVWLEAALAGLALVAALAARTLDANVVHYTLIVVLALAMGLQNATARRLAVPDLTTTVLTLTLTGLAADSNFAGGKGANLGRRVTAVAGMFAGAAIGAVLLLRHDIVTALAATCGTLALTAVLACVQWSTPAPWAMSNRPS